jgi:hypothetical protein
MSGHGGVYGTDTVPPDSEMIANSAHQVSNSAAACHRVFPSPLQYCTVPSPPRRSVMVFSVFKSKFWGSDSPNYVPMGFGSGLGLGVLGGSPI